MNIYKWFRKKYSKEIKDAKENIEPYLTERDTSVKKIAFCVSGHVRDYIRIQKNFEEFKQYISTFGDVDIFLATWDKQNTQYCWSGAHGLSLQDSYTIDINKEALEQHYKTKNILIYNEQFFASTFSPLQYKYFTNKIYNWDGRGENNGIVGSYKMFFLIYQANILKLYQEFLNQQSYDWVFRLRPDTVFDMALCETVIKLDQLDNSNYYTPGLRHDQFSFGGSDIMNKYASVFIRSFSCYNNDTWGDPEQILYNSHIDFITNNGIIIPKVGFLIPENPYSPLRFR